MKKMKEILMQTMKMVMIALMTISMTQSLITQTMENSIWKLISSGDKSMETKILEQMEPQKKVKRKRMMESMMTRTRKVEKMIMMMKRIVRSENSR